MNRVYRFNGSCKSYILVTGIGFLVGIITRLSDYLPYDTLWSFSSIASAFGFWIVTTTCIILFSSSNKNASINVLLYLSTMNVTFYILQYVLGVFIERFCIEHVNWSLLLLYEGVAIVAAGVSYILYFWNRNTVYSNILYGLPLCGLGAETLGVIRFFIHTETYLFQLLFMVTILIGSLMGYQLLYSGVV